MIRIAFALSALLVLGGTGCGRTPVVGQSELDGSVRSDRGGGEDRPPLEFDAFRRDQGPTPRFDGSLPNDVRLGSPCGNDCDCSEGEACVNNTCLVASRFNQCCFARTCPPGLTCQLPGGALSICPGGPPDGGPDPDFPTNDLGPKFDGGGFDFSEPDGFFFDGSFDFGDRDMGIGTPCANDCQCDRQLACLGGQCTVANRNNQCCDNPFCPAGSACIQPDGSAALCPGGETPVGAACLPGGGTCGPNGFCISPQMSFPGGYCSQGCSPQFPCPQGASCHSGQDGNAFCLDDCVSSNECRSGYQCIRLGLDPQRVCFPTPPGSMNPMGGPVGAGCGTDNDCQTGLTCLTEQEQGFPGGYCTKPYCDPQTNPCPQNSDCYNFPGLFSTCLAECPSGGEQSTCRPDYYCLGPTGQPGACVQAR